MKMYCTLWRYKVSKVMDVDGCVPVLWIDCGLWIVDEKSGGSPCFRHTHTHPEHARKMDYNVKNVPKKYKR